MPSSVTHRLCQSASRFVVATGDPSAFGVHQPVATRPDKQAMTAGSAQPGNTTRRMLPRIDEDASLAVAQEGVVPEAEKRRVATATTAAHLEACAIRHLYPGGPR